MISKKQIEHIVERYHIKLGRFKYRDGIIEDVQGDVNITNTSLRKLPLTFGKVNGNFFCHGNKLHNLVGAPHTVTGNFNCSNNQLKSLLGSPKIIGGDFCCHENDLTSLMGCPKYIFGNFNAFLNKLVTLKGAPEVIEGNCVLFENRLISLECGPRYVGQSLHITGNLLTNLVGIPKTVGNMLTIDDRVSLYMGNQNCVVKRIEINVQGNKKVGFLPKLILDKQKFLPVIFKYMKYLDIYSPDGNFNQPNFEDIVFDIEEGLR